MLAVALEHVNSWFVDKPQRFELVRTSPITAFNQELMDQGGSELDVMDHSECLLHSWIPQRWDFPFG